MDDEIQTSEAPDGAELTPAPAAAPAELSADMKEAIHRRNTMSVKLAQRDAQVADLQAKLRAATLPLGEAADPAKPSEAPDGVTLHAVMAELQELKLSVTGDRDQKSRAAVVKDALNKVPELHRDQADLVLAGLEARGTIKLGAETTSDDLVNALHEHSPELLRAQGRRVAPQVSATGEINWDRYKSISEVPRDLIGQCPDKHWARLKGAGGSRAPMAL